jgi:heptosyltransferase-2
LLLTDALPDIKREGLKHELDYNLDLLRFLGVKTSERSLAISLNPEQEEKAAAFLRSHGADGKRPLIALHPGASCPSKRWPAARFAHVADRLIEGHNTQVILVTGPAEVGIGQAVLGFMRNRPLTALGTLTPAQLAAVLRKSRLLVSNDSGPVHLACAVGTPVVAIFGRWGGGLSPIRWGPTGEKSVVLHHDVGCRPCLAHRCPIGFVCLDAVSVDEVLAAAVHLADLNPVDQA